MRIMRNCIRSKKDFEVRGDLIVNEWRSQSMGVIRVNFLQRYISSIDLCQLKRIESIGGKPTKGKLP